MSETDLSIRPELRIGIDLGGTKIAAIALDRHDNILSEKRISSPQNDYQQTLNALSALIIDLESQVQLKDHQAHVGIGIPGSLSPRTQTVQNANSTWLNGRALHKDLSEIIHRPLRFENDANCFALSEAVDGSGADYNSVFGVIIGTGCGGGFVLNKEIVNGPRSIAGEWGHTPLPWPKEDEYPGRECWCGQYGCMETWVSGPALSYDHQLVTGNMLTPQEMVLHALKGDKVVQASFDRYVSRLSRGLAMVVNILDPDIIVLGGGLSQIEGLYQPVTQETGAFIFSDDKDITIRPPKHGAASGVRGAAWLWNRFE